MTHKEVMEQVKKTIIQDVQGYLVGKSEDFKKTLAEDIAKSILSIPEILIKDPDQSLPSNPYGARTNQEVYHRAISDFKKENWVKVLEEKSNE